MFLKNIVVRRVLVCSLEIEIVGQKVDKPFFGHLSMSDKICR